MNNNLKCKIDKSYANYNKLFKQPHVINKMCDLLSNELKIKDEHVARIIMEKDTIQEYCKKVTDDILEVYLDDIITGEIRKCNIINYGEVQAWKEYYKQLFNDNHTGKIKKVLHDKIKNNLIKEVDKAISIHNSTIEQ